MISTREDTELKAELPKIAILSSDEQKQYITAPKMLLVDRNPYTGWPLLQVSLFSIAAEKSAQKPIYTHMLGGGKCHHLFIGAFLFASLLTKVPPLNKVTITSWGASIPPEQFTIENLQQHLHGYSVTHERFKISISEKNDTYGKIVQVTVPEGTDTSLEKALDNSFSFAMKDSSNIGDLGHWSDRFFSEEQIKQAIKPGYGIFSNGQVFVDLGSLLNQTKDSDLINYLEGVFQVDKFLSLPKEAPLPKISEENETPVLSIASDPHSPTLAVPNKIEEKEEKTNTQHHKKQLEQYASSPNQEPIEPEALRRFKQSIERINPGSKAFNDLYNAIIEEKVDATTAPYNIIIEHFTEEAIKFALDPQQSQLDIEQSMRALNVKLYGKPPMSQKVKAAIFAVIGAVLGCVIGGVIGAIATGGFGGLATATLGAATGFKIGMGAGLGIGLTGGGITGAYSAKQNNALFFSTVENKKAALNPIIKNRMEAFKQ